MSVLDPMWFAWQRRIGQRTFAAAAREAGIPNLTSEIEFVPDLGSDKSPLHHLAWSYPSQVKRIWRSWRQRKTSGIVKREIARKYADEAGEVWSELLQTWLPADTMAVVYDDEGVSRLMVKFANGGPVIEGEADDQAPSHQEWSAWHYGARGFERSYGATPGEAVRKEVYAWAVEQPLVRSLWLSRFCEHIGALEVEDYGQPAAWAYFEEQEKTEQEEVV